MKVALLIYESPDAFATRKNDKNDPYLGAWRAYYKTLVEAGVYVGGGSGILWIFASYCRVRNR